MGAFWRNASTIIAAAVIVDRFLKGLCTFENCVHNEGIAFGLFFSREILLIVSMIVGVFLFWWLWHFKKNRNDRGVFAISCIVAGAFSNGYDRIAYGHVLDYWQPFSFFAAFNMADVLISFGAIVVLTDIFLKREKL